MGAHKPPLVYQHLERIPIDTLIKYRAQLVRHIKGKNGVYALYKGRKLYYVGLAKSLSQRLTAHQKDKHSGLWDSCSVYLTTGDQHLREIEALVMRIAGPQGNTQRGKLSRSENLMKILKSDLAASFREEMNLLTGNGLLKKVPRKAKLTTTGWKGELGRYTKKTFRVKGKLKGRTVHAMVRMDGRVRFNSVVYESPSGAARAACGRSSNGWSFWHFQRAKGYWVPLEELRK